METLKHETRRATLLGKFVVLPWDEKRRLAREVKRPIRVIARVLDGTLRSESTMRKVEGWFGLQEYYEQHR